MTWILKENCYLFCIFKTGKGLTSKVVQLSKQPMPEKFRYWNPSYLKDMSVWVGPENDKTTDTLREELTMLGESVETTEELQVQVLL